jgi:hypothetical protein
MSERKYHTEEPARSTKRGAGTDPDEFTVKKGKVLWEVAELVTFFSIAKLPEAPVQLSECQTIVNVERFLSSHLETIKKHNGNKTYQPYYDRLILFKKIIENQKL